MREVGGLALEVFTYRVAAAIGALAVALDGLDSLAFTAGIGENSSLVRARICERLGFLGVELEEDANERAIPDCVISNRNVTVHVVRAREELIAARAAVALLT
jgi:acetate kinase